MDLRNKIIAKYHFLPECCNCPEKKNGVSDIGLRAHGL